MVKRLNLTAQLQRLDQLNEKKKQSCDFSLDKQNGISDQNQTPKAPDPQPIRKSLNTKESLSTMDSVLYEQSSPETVLQADTVGNSQHTLGDKRQVGFTQVPNEILRSAGLFEDPMDFMIYLSLFSYSYGYGRKTADMSQVDIEKLAGVSKNRVKRSFERLIKQRWIKLVQEYERSHTKRKWRVYLPEERTPEGRKSGSKADTVQNGQSPKETPALSTVNTVTLSKMDTYKESIQTKIQINTLTPENEKIRKYFADLKPHKKRESEQIAYRGLTQDYLDQEIADCLDHLIRKGICGPEGSRIPCHSPMAFLAKAMDVVLAEVKEVSERESVLKKQNAAVLETRLRLEREAEARAREWEMGVG